MPRRQRRADDASVWRREYAIPNRMGNLTEELYKALSVTSSRRQMCVLHLCKDLRYPEGRWGSVKPLLCRPCGRNGSLSVFGPLALMIYGTSELHRSRWNDIFISAIFLCVKLYGSIVMNSLRCPRLDRLGRDLIEAYRQVGDADILSLPQHPEGSELFLCVHRKMAEHRRSCFLCQQSESTSRSNHNVPAILN